MATISQSDRMKEILRLSGIDPDASNPSTVGTSLPGVAQPRLGSSQSDLFYAQAQQQYGQELAKYFLGADARALTGTIIGHKLMTGGNGSIGSFLSSDEGQATRLAISAAINSGLGKMVSSQGNILNLGAGIGNAVAQGVTANTTWGQGGPGTPIAGRGAMTDIVTKGVFDDVYSHFIGPGGASRLHRTHGASFEQIGQMITELGESGAFVGESAGTFGLDEQSKGYKLEEGGALQEKIKKMTEQGLELTKFLGDLTGSDDVRQMLRLASAVTGISSSEVNSGRRMLNEIKDTARMAQTLGMDAGTTMERIAARGGGPIATRAVFDARTLAQGQKDMRNAVLDRGGWRPEVNEEAMANRQQAAVTAAIDQDPTAVGAMWLLQNSPRMQGHENKIRSLIQNIGNAKSGDARKDARAALDAYVKDNGLVGAGGLQGVVNTHGGVAAIMENGLSRANQKFLSDFGASSNRSELMDGNMNALAFNMNVDKNYGFENGTVVGLSRMMLDQVSSHDQESGYVDENQQYHGSFMEAVGSGDIDRMTEIINKSHSTPEQKKAMIDKYTQAIADAGGGATGGARVANALREFENARMQDKALQTITRPEDEIANKNINLEKRFQESAFGDGGPESLNFLETLGRGYAGGENLGSKQVIQELAYNEDQRGKLLDFDIQKQDDGSYTADLTDEQAQKMTEMKGLAEALGVENNADAIKGALKEGGGVTKLMDFFDVNEYATHANQADKSGKRKVYAADKKTAEESRARITKATNALLKDQLGVDLTEDPQALETKFAADKNAYMNILRDPSGKGKALSAYEGQSKEKLQEALDRVNKEIDKGGHWGSDKKLLQTHKEDLEKKKAEVDAKQKEKSKDEKGSGDEMVATIKLIMDDSVVAELHDARKLGKKK